MLKIIYGPEADPISDFKVEVYVELTIKLYNKFHSISEIRTCSELCFTTFALSVLEGKLPHEEIEFYFKDKKLDFNMVNGIINPYNETMGFFADVTMKCVNAGIENMKKKKEAEKNRKFLDWTHSKNGYWIASRPMSDGVFDHIYVIHPVEGGYTADASNNAFGGCKVAVKDENCTEESIFENLEELMDAISNREILWLYTSHCNCIGEIRKEED